MPKIKDLTGQVFHRLTVVEFDSIIKGKAHWKCQCSCGNVVVKSGNLMSSGNTKSCGCYSSEQTILRCRKEKGESGLSYMYASYKKGAKRKNHSFSLTREDFKKITQQKCHYCGKSPTQIYLNPSSNDPSMTVEGRENAKYICNGIDRKNNNLGYELENCLPCCKKCNLLKSNMSYEEFIATIYSISNNLRINNV